MRHLLSLFMRDLILIQGKMKSSSYGLLLSFMRDLLLIQGKVKSSSYGLLTELALLVVFGYWPELHHMHYMHGQIPLKR